MTSFPFRLRGFFFDTFLCTSGFSIPSCAGVLPILYNPVSQTGHFPRVAGVPEEVNVGSGLSISLFSLHFTQYASIKINSAKKIFPILAHP